MLSESLITNITVPVTGFDWYPAAAIVRAVGDKEGIRTMKTRLRRLTRVRGRPPP